MEQNQLKNQTASSKMAYSRTYFRLEHRKSSHSQWTQTCTFSRSMIESMIWSVHSPLFFRPIVKIERFGLRAAILHECQNYLGGRAIIPDARLLGTLYLKINMAAINGKTRYTSTISRKNRGLWTVYQ